MGSMVKSKRGRRGIRGSLNAEEAAMKTNHAVIQATSMIWVPWNPTHLAKIFPARMAVQPSGHGFQPGHESLEVLDLGRGGHADDTRELADRNEILGRCKSKGCVLIGIWDEQELDAIRARIVAPPVQ
ncbi:hypothetical protein [Bradyrhizobium sp. URHC0002]